MADERDRRTLGDYITLRRGTTYKSRLLGQPGPLLLGLATIQRNGGFREDSLQTYGGDSPAKLLVSAGDLYLSLKDVTQSADLLGAVARLPIDYGPGRLTQDTVRLEPKSADVPLDYLYWLLRTPQYRAYCRAHATGTTNLGLPREDFLAFPVPALTPARLKLVELLEILDDKITLNRRTSKTLEAIARALFKSWFVNFDPVRAKADGHDPGLPEHLAAFFPESFEDSELGGIPRTWRVASVGDVCDVIDCLHSKKPERATRGLPLLQLGNIRDNGLIDMDDTYFIGETEYRRWISRMEARPGDCVITNVGRVGAVGQMPMGLRAALGRNMTGIRCKPKFPFPTFIIQCLLSDSMKAEMSLKTDTGTILDALNVRNIPKLRFVLPTDDALVGYERVCRPLRARMESALTESATLVALRDSLLPKLISGALRIKNPERVAAGAL